MRAREPSWTYHHLRQVFHDFFGLKKAWRERICVTSNCLISVDQLSVGVPILPMCIKLVGFHVVLAFCNLHTTHHFKVVPSPFWNTCDGGVTSSPPLPRVHHHCHVLSWIEVGRGYNWCLFTNIHGLEIWAFVLLLTQSPTLPCFIDP
jgi:hypothetical protein